ncbi:hypothetical protein D3C72_1826750 [compost metagenome]
MPRPACGQAPVGGKVFARHRHRAQRQVGKCTHLVAGDVGIDGQPAGIDQHHARIEKDIDLGAEDQP